MRKQLPHRKDCRQLVFLVFLVLSAFLLLSCKPAQLSSASAESSGDLSSTELSLDASELRAKGSPWKDWFVFGLLTKEDTPRLEDDFYMAINADWIANETQKGHDYNSASLERSDEIALSMADLLESGESVSPAIQQDLDNLRIMHELFKDWDARDACGIQPLMPMVERINSIESLSELSEYLCSDDFRLSLSWRGNEYDERIAGHALFGLYAYADSEQTPTQESYSLYVMPPNCELAPLVDLIDSAESLTSDDAALYTYKKAAQDGEIAQAVLVRLGYENNEARALLRQAAEIDKQMQDAIDSSDSSWAGSTIDEFEDVSPNFPWREILSAYGYDAPTRMSCEAYDWLGELGEIFCDKNLEALKSHLLVSLLIDSSSLLDGEAYDSASSASGESFLPQKMTEQLQLWPDASEFELPEDELLKNERIYYANLVQEALRASYSKVYVERFYDASQNELVRQMIRDLIESYEDMLEEQSWLSRESRDAIIDKLSAIGINVGFPDAARSSDTSTLKLEGRSKGATLFSQMRAIAAWNLEQEKRNFAKSLKEQDWTDYLDVNAYYYPLDNAMYVGAGILGGAFWSLDASYEELLGSMGFTIAHEISHAFDSDSIYYDKYGHRNAAWTEAEFDEFERRVNRLSSRLESIDPLGIGGYDGSLVCGETIADMAGMKALMKHAATISDFDYDACFRSFARSWASILSYPDALENFEYDFHTFDNHRVNVTLQELDEFYESYAVKQGDGMWLDPSERVSVW